jgi:hypothetical protein
MDSLKGIISDLHVFLYGGMRTLPITLAGTMVIIGLFTANYAMMFLLAGFLVVVPVIVLVLNKLIEFASITFKTDMFKTKMADVCDLVIPFSTLDNPSPSGYQYILCTTSIAMTAFFLGYVLKNGMELYSQKQEEGADPAKVSNRKTHAILAIGSIIVFAALAIGFRAYTGCEPMFGLFVGTIMFGLLGSAWYTMLSKPSGGRLADIFGISNRIISPSASQPVACMIDPNA